MQSNRRESVGRRASQQSASAPASQQMVSVAVLPPRFAQGVAPPSGIAAAECFNWDERVNWTHNEPVEKEDDKSEKKSFMKKIGLSTDRKKRNEDLPPFQFRQVPYDVWRKHYAKDKDGNYHGTHAPAEDCLLKPEDVAKWRLGEARTKADLWTRGTERLPVYDEVKQEGEVPEYQDNTVEADRTDISGPSPQYEERSQQRREIMNGMTAEEIIAAEKEKQASQPKGNMTWKQRIQRGAEIASMGSGSG
jgi:hypothetical protein